MNAGMDVEDANFFSNLKDERNKKKIKLIVIND